MLTTLDHVVVLVRDLDLASATYSRLLGLQPSWHGSQPDAGTASTIFRLERSSLELLAVDTEGSLADPLGGRLATVGEGPLALAFGTPDAEACARELRASGLEASAPRAGAGYEERSNARRHWRSVSLAPEGTRGVRLFAIEHLSPPETLPPAAAIGSPEAAASHIDHVVLQTGDPEAAIHLYRDQLGLRLALDRTFEAWGMRLMFFRIGGVTVEVAHPLRGGADPSDSFWGISWHVPDADAARARLAGSGFDVSEVRPGRRPNTRVCTVRHPTHGVATLMIG